MLEVAESEPFADGLETIQESDRPGETPDWVIQNSSAVWEESAPMCGELATNENTIEDIANDTMNARSFVWRTFIGQGEYISHHRSCPQLPTEHDSSPYASSSTRSAHQGYISILLCIGPVNSSAL